MSLVEQVKNPGYKRPLDLLILVLAHILFAPLWIVLWTLIPLLIWLGDRGPVFFRQLRAGQGGREFIILKFRTMVPDADKRGPAWTTLNDSRVTPVGRILRRTAMDELPELLSIWRGHMSLVGPRALDCEEQRLLETQIPGFELRLRVLPGLTGLAQIYDKTDKAQEKIKYDLKYIEQMSLMLDLKLLLLSIKNSLLAKWDQRGGKDYTTSS